MEKALRFLSAPDNDSLFGMRRAVSALDMFSRDSSSQLHLDSLVVSVLEEGEDAADPDGGDGDGGDSGLPDDVPRPRRERVVSEGSTGSAGSGARGLRRRSSTVVVSRVASARAVRARRDARHRKSLPLFAMRLFGRKSSSASSSEDAAGSQSPADLEKSASSGNLSSTKSAPATPVGERLQAGAAQAAASSASSVRRRAAGTPSVAPSSSTPTLVPLPSPATSKARHKKFHRHFDSVAPDERVLNYYSCALISDILLQGHLYITSNYFAFYSNVFGYVTKLLIPTASVLKVSKEKTARIIPNAIGVATSDEKHVFGSLLSRDNTYKLMVQVWKTALGPPPHGPHPPQLPAAPLPKELKDEVDSASVSGDVLQEDDDSSLSGDGGPGGLPPVPLDKTPIVKAACKVNASSASSPAAILAPGAALGAAAGASPAEGLAPGAQLAQLAQLRRGTRQTIILGVSTALVAFLLLSTALLFHRMSRIQDQFRIQSGDNLYQDLARWQTHLHARSASQVEEFLNTHLDQLAKVRKSLEALTLLIVSNDDDRMQHADVMMHHHSPYRDQKQQTRPPSPSAEPDAKNS